MKQFFLPFFSAVDVTDAAALFVALILIRHAFLCAENIWRLFRPRPDVRAAEDGSSRWLWFAAQNAAAAAFNEWLLSEPRAKNPVVTFITAARP